MEYSIVSTVNENLILYTKANPYSAKVGVSLLRGSIVKVLSRTTVNNREWAYVDTGDYRGWVVEVNPNSNAKNLERVTYDSPTIKPDVQYATTASTAIDRMYESAVAKQTSTTGVSSLSSENSSIYRRETTGQAIKLKDYFETSNQSSVTEGVLTSTVEVTPATLDSVFNMKQTGTKSHVKGDPSTMPPEIIQNEMGFPPVAGFNPITKRYEYDYSTDISDNSFVKAITDLRKSLNISEESSIELYDRFSKFYNRFKIAMPDTVLQKTFSHVFFTRPDCNIVNYMGNGRIELTDEFINREYYLSEFNNNKNTLMQLSGTTGLDHQFMMLPSNRARSFETKDVTLTTENYGKTLHGNSIAYGRITDASRAVDTFSVSFEEDRDLHISKLHNYWIDYIEGVNKGFYMPRDLYLMDKQLDYACAVYFFLCAENGEDIIYWTKIYGVFPTNIPGSVFSYSKGQSVNSIDNEINITYQYSWRSKDWDPKVLLEFNMLSDKNHAYARTYNPDILSTGNTWVGAPFVEQVRDNIGRLTYKLRFRES